MKSVRKDGGPERRIVISMITDNHVCGRIAHKWDRDLFKSKVTGLVASWCVQYFNKYEKAPGKAIEGMFKTWAEKEKDESTIALVERFLEGVSDQYEQQQEDNSDYIVDLAAEHFKKVKLQKHAEKLQALLDSDELKEAQEEADSFTNIDLGVGEGIDVFNDPSFLERAFEARKEPIVRYPEALANFFGNSLYRGAFISFEGPEKRGKSYWLQDLAWRAMRQKRNVAYFEVGDLTEADVALRFAVRAAKRPLYATRGNADQSLNHPVKIPTSIEVEAKKRETNVEYDEKDFDTPFDLEQAQAAFAKINKKNKSGDPQIMLSCHPSDTLTVRDIHSIIQGWERERGWVPDIIVIDYADILAPERASDDKRDQINKTWMGLRKLSQVYHALVVTATQSDAAGGKAYTLGRDNFSEDKRKRAHVTGSIGINQTDEEKELQVQRLNWIVRREHEYIESRCCHVAGCLAIANPAIKSTF